jgi:hypothetical protein
MSKLRSSRSLRLSAVSKFGQMGARWEAALGSEACSPNSLPISHAQIAGEFR